MKEDESYPDVTPSKPLSSLATLLSVYSGVASIFVAPPLCSDETTKHWQSDFCAIE